MATSSGPRPAFRHPGRAPGNPLQRGPVTRYLGSKKNIAGCVGALGGLALFFAGIVAPPLWPAVVAGLYGIGALVAPTGTVRSTFVRTSTRRTSTSRWTGS